MAYSVPVGAILEATIRGKLFEQVTLSLFHYGLNDTDIPDGRAFITTFNNVFNAAGGVYDKYRAAVSQDWTCDEITYQWIWPTRFRRVSFAGFVGSGSVLQPSLPQNVAMVITKESEQADRHGVGTLHVPGVPVDGVLGGNLADGQAILLSNLAATLTAAYVTGRMDPLIFNRSNPAASRIINLTKVQKTVRVMRRRTVGLGV